MILVINIKILQMKKIHNLTLINMMYVDAYFGTVLQCSCFIFDNWSRRSG